MVARPFFFVYNVGIKERVSLMASKATLALTLGILSWISMIIALVLALLIDEIGFISIVRLTTVPFSIIGIIITRTHTEEPITDELNKTLKISFYLSLSALIVVGLSILFVALIFIPGLFI